MGGCLFAMCDVPEEYQGVFSSEAEVRRQYEQLLPKLSIAQMQPGNVIKISGICGYFNPAPLLNPSWMQGRMSQEEYIELIGSVNSCVLRILLGQPKVLTLYNRHLRGMDHIARSYQAIRAYLNTIVPWWSSYRGINIAFQEQPKQMQRGRIYNPLGCDLLFAILDQPIRHVPITVSTHAIQTDQTMEGYPKS